MKRVVLILLAVVAAGAAGAVYFFLWRPSEKEAKTVYWALRDGDVDRMRLLLDDNPRLLDFFHNEGTPLTHATGLYPPIDNRNAIVRLLLERGADPNGEGWRALHGCIYSNDGECIQLLLDHGADPLLKNAEGKTALDYARSSAAEGIPEIIEDHLKKQGRI